MTIYLLYSYFLSVSISQRSLITLSTLQSHPSNVSMFFPGYYIFFLLSLLEGRALHKAMFDFYIHFCMLVVANALFVLALILLICSFQFNRMSMAIPRKWVFSLQDMIQFLSVISIISLFLFQNIMFTVLLGKKLVFSPMPMHLTCW